MAEADAPGAQTGQAPAVQPAAVKRRPWLRRILILIGLVVLAFLIYWVIHYERVGKYEEATNDAYVAADSVTISPKIAGYVDQVFVGDNQRVAAGQPLVRIDPRDYRAQASQYQAQIDVANANAANVQAMIREQQAAIAQAQAQLADAENQARFAAGEVDRYTPLAASGAETREKLQSLRTQAQQARDQVAANRAALESARRRIGALQAQVNQAKAQGEASAAQLAAAKVNLGSTLLTSSIAGRVGDKTVRVGQFVQAGTRLMTIVPLTNVYITANFKETQLGLMRPGEPATITVDALPGVTLTGKVQSISPGTGAQFSLLPPQNATGNFTKIVQRVPVRIAIDPVPALQGLLVPGMSVNATVDTRAMKGAIDRLKQQQQARAGGQG